MATSIEKRKQKLFGRIFSMYKFQLDETQIKKFEKWKKKQKKKDPTTFTAGERWTFMFTPTGLGLVVHVKDNLINEEIDLTDWDNF